MAANASGLAKNSVTAFGVGRDLEQMCGRPVDASCTHRPGRQPYGYSSGNRRIRAITLQEGKEGILSRTRGFTLIELLVVIAIIAILASILFPVFARAKEAAQKSVCESNVQQIALGFQLYLQDWNNTYPYNKLETSSGLEDNPGFFGGRYWRWPLVPYVAQSLTHNPSDPTDDTHSNDVETVFHCPSDPTPTSTYDSTSYFYSACFYFSPDQINQMTKHKDIYPYPYSTGRFTPIPQKESAVVYPSQKVLIGEWLSNHEYPHVSPWDTKQAWAGARVYGFADGHVAYIQTSKIHPAVDGSPDTDLTVNGVVGKDIN